MITLKTVNKTFNPKKSNELHVLKNISLELPRSGLVAIYGKSGCGKSTLLNCIGGIENIDTGSIIFDGNEYRKSYAISNYRARNIAFVFQDYKLIENCSVEENIQIALDIAGKERSKEKVDAVLSAVKMPKYNKRKVNTLSGGQKQRIAIARAMAMEPKIILADEPTGNLDQNNAENIMNMLKAISKNILVILVSHDDCLVNKFADRKIELSDGAVISDKSNESIYTSEKIFDDNTVFLEDYNKSCINVDGRNINLFYKNLSDDLDIVIDNNDIMLNEGIRVKNTAFQARRTEKTPIKETGPIFEIRELNNCKPDRKKKMLNQFKLSMHRTKRISAIIIAVCAVFIAFSMSFLGEAENIDESKFRYSDSNSLTMYSNKLTKESLKSISNEDYVEFVMPISGSPIEVSISQSIILQSSNTLSDRGSQINMEAKPLPIKFVQGSNLFLGRMPQNDNEIVIDKSFIDKIFNQYDVAKYGQSGIFGIVTFQGFLDCEIVISDIQAKIVGISKGLSPTIYMNEDLIYLLALKNRYEVEQFICTINYANFTEQQILNLPFNEAVISKNEFIEKGFIVGENNQYTIKKKTFVIKNYYELNTNSKNNNVIISSNTLNDWVYECLTQSSTSAEIIVNNKEEASVKIDQDYGIFASSTYEQELEYYLKYSRNIKIIQYVFTVIIIIAAILLCFMSVKSTILQRKEEYFVKCMLGQKRRVIFGKLIAESSIFCAIFALPFYLLTSFFIRFVFFDFGAFSMFNLTPMSFLLGLLVLISISVFATFLAAMKFLFKS